MHITVITSGHLSTCPRMLKAADALAADGHRLRVVATLHEPWAVAADVDVRSRRSWPVTAVDYRRGDSGPTYWRTGVRSRAARAAVAALGAAKVPYPVAVRAFSRVHSEIVAAATSDRSDFIYGGTTGALAAVAESARRLGVPYAVDFEDLHSGETDAGVDPLHDRLAARIEAAVLKRAAFATTSSEAIAAEYERLYGVKPHTIHNTFPLPKAAPDFRRPSGSCLRLYWFSQTIGPGRGLEDTIAAIGRAGIAAQLTLRGRPQAGYLAALSQLSAARAPRLRLTQEPPAPPDAMVDLARPYDVGLAFEPAAPFNRTLCLSNKVFTYVLAGLAVLTSDTAGTRAFGRDLGAGAALVPPGDIDALSAAIAEWAHDPARLECARRSAWSAAVRRWRWDHPLEAGRLCDLFRGVA